MIPNDISILGEIWDWVPQLLPAAWLVDVETKQRFHAQNINGIMCFFKTYSGLLNFLASNPMLLCTFPSTFFWPLQMILF